MSGQAVTTGRTASALWLLATLVVGGLLLGFQLRQGWFPHDEGALGQSAERVLGGELPHRDFSELYTGLLTWLHAAAFKIGGIHTTTLRIPLFAATMVWLVAFYRIAVRFAPPAGAALLAAVALVWSVPNYPAGIPSWYNLFFATFGLLALVRWHEERHRRWLVLAGLAGGVSFLFKLSGVFFVFGGMLALTFASTGAVSRQRDAPADLSTRTSRAVQAGIAVLLCAFVVLLTLAVVRHGESAIVRFVLPLSLVAAAIAARELELSAPSRATDLARVLVPFIAGAAAPVIAFAGWFAVHGALPDFVNGVFVAPFRRLDFASYRAPHVTAMLYAAPWLWLLRAQHSTALSRRPELIAASLAAAYVIYASARDGQYYRVGWYSAWSLLFVLVALAWPLLRRSRLDAASHGSIAVTASIVAVACTLVEYPFAAPIYTLYALPLTMLAVAGLVHSRGGSPVPNQILAAAFFLVFGALRVVPGTVEDLGRHYARSTESAELDLTRSNLLVRQVDADRYHELIGLVAEQPVGATIWAGPDAPEVYFLANRVNPTRTLFDFLDESPTTKPAAERLRAINPTMVVVNLRPQFSQPLPPTVIDSLAVWYPNRRDIDGFAVFWR